MTKKIKFINRVNEKRMLEEKLDDKLSIVFMQTEKNSGFSSFVDSCTNKEGIYNGDEYKNVYIYKCREENIIDFSVELFTNILDTKTWKEKLNVFKCIKEFRYESILMIASSILGFLSIFLGVLSNLSYFSVIKNNSIFKKEYSFLLTINAIVLVVIIIDVCAILRCNKKVREIVANQSGKDRIKNNIIRYFKAFKKKDRVVLIVDLPNDNIDNVFIELLFGIASIPNVLLVTSNSYKVSQSLEVKAKQSEMEFHIEKFHLPNEQFIKEVANSAGISMTSSRAKDILLHSNYNIYEIFKKVFSDSKFNTSDEVKKRLILYLGIYNGRMSMEKAQELFAGDSTFVVDASELNNIHSKYINCGNNEFSLSDCGFSHYNSYDEKDVDLIYLQTRVLKILYENINDRKLYDQEIALSLAKIHQPKIAKQIANITVKQRIINGMPVIPSDYGLTDFTGKDIIYNLLYLYDMKYYDEAIELVNSSKFREAVTFENLEYYNVLISILMNRNEDYDGALEILNRIDCKNVSVEVMTLVNSYKINSYLNKSKVESAKQIYMDNNMSIKKNNKFASLFFRVSAPIFSDDDLVVVSKKAMKFTEKKISPDEYGMCRSDLARAYCEVGNYNLSKQFFNEAFEFLKQYSNNTMYIHNNNYAILLLLNGKYDEAIHKLELAELNTVTYLQKMATNMNLFIAKMLKDKTLISVEEIKNIEENFVANNSHGRVKQQFYINALFAHKYITGFVSDYFLEQAKKYHDRNGLNVTMYYIDNILAMDIENFESVLKCYKPVYLAYWYSKSNYLLDLLE